MRELQLLQYNQQLLFDGGDAEQLIEPEREQRCFHPQDLNAWLVASAPGQFRRQMLASSLNIVNQLLLTYNEDMKIKVIVHEAEEGGYWAEVPSIPGCATQGETFEELLQNLYEAVEGCLSVDVSPAQINESDRVLEIAV